MRKSFTFKAKLSKGTEPDTYPVTMLVGDQSFFLGEDIYIPATEIAIAAHSMESQPLNLDHSHAVADEVGFVRGAAMKDKGLTGSLVLTPTTAKYATAKGFIENRFAAGTPPEVSVGVYMDINEEDAASGGKRLAASNLAFDHLALVTRGACSPGAGCGVGMCRCAHSESESKDVHMTTDETFAEAEPEEKPQAAPTPDPKTDPAPEPTPEAAAEAEAEAAACACGGAEAIASARAEADEMKTIARAALKPRAVALGLDVADDECVKTLTRRIADAEKVHAKLAAAQVAAKGDGAGARRHTTAAPPAKEKAASEWEEAERLLAAAGHRARIA